jgi:putative Ca2+/H+ antiporter (TMEM165/GDT1 family)
MFATLIYDSGLAALGTNFITITLAELGDKTFLWL